MSSSTIAKFLNKVLFGGAYAGEESDKYTLKQAMAEPHLTVPKKTVDLMKYHGTNYLVTDRNGQTFFMRDGKKVKVALPPGDEDARYTNATYDVINKMGGLINPVNKKKSVKEYIDNLKYGF